MLKATRFTFFTMIIRREQDVFFLHLTYQGTAFAHKRLRTEAGTTSSKVPLEDYGLGGSPGNLITANNTAVSKPGAQPTKYNVSIKKTCPDFYNFLFGMNF